MVHISICVYADDIIILGISVYRTKYGSLSNQRIGLEAIADKTKWSYMVMARYQVAGKFHVLKIDNKTS